MPKKRKYNDYNRDNQNNQDNENGENNSQKKVKIPDSSTISKEIDVTESKIPETNQKIAELVQPIKKK